MKSVQDSLPWIYRLPFEIREEWMGTQAVTFPSCFGMATLSRQTQCPLFLQSLRLYHCLCYDESLDCLDNKNESKRKALAGYCKTELAFCNNLINILLLHFSTDYFYLLKKSRLRNSQFFSREHCETVEATKTLPPPPPSPTPLCTTITYIHCRR